MHKGITTKKVNNLKNGTKWNLNNNNNNRNNNKDNNDSNRKGKTLVVATKKTLEILKDKFLAGFLKQDCFKVLAVLFTIINQVFFVAIISFSLIITIIVIIIIVFLILILFILFSIYHYIFFIKYYSYFTIFLFIFLSFIYFFFKFIFVPFSSFIFFFAIFLSLCASNESIKCFICMLSFLILSSLAFCKYYKKSAKIIRTIGKTQVPFAFLVVLLLVLSWTI